MNISLSVTRKQKAFIDADQSEVLFGGAAGGGKSYGQIVDALLFALRYPASKQLILRRTFAELDKSLIRTALALYPRDLFSFSGTSHTGQFKNGSIIDFGYCATESDVYRYQSSEYDVIRFDELTHFTEDQYVYLISRVRGKNSYPKQLKSTTNPGGIGHAWVKARFIDGYPPNTERPGTRGMNRIFIPSKLRDNRFLLEFDPDYAARLEALPREERRALLDGDWDVFEGQYFTEFQRERHVVTPYPLPEGTRIYRTIDYGLDRLVCLWIAVHPSGRSTVFRELCESDLPISRAAEAILEFSPKDEDVYATLAPPDLFARVQETGRTKAEIFGECGVRLTKTSNERETGWLAIKELLCKSGEAGGLEIFETCPELIRTLPALVRDKLRPTDCANEPHDLTHAPDALRGFAIFHTAPKRDAREGTKRQWSRDMWEDYLSASGEDKKYLKKKYGEPI